MTRSEIMSRIRSVSRLEDKARPMVRRLAKCRLRHQPDMFGRPDFGNKSRKVAVFVNGCFWHQPCPKRCAKAPKTNKRFWSGKFRRNRERHREVVKELRRRDYKVLVLWEHSICSK